MKILVESSKLAKACALANKNIPGKTTLPIIKNIHIAAEGNMLKVSSTDMETWVVYNVPATVEYDDVPASFCLDASNITSLLQAIPSQPITIEIQKNKPAAMGVFYYAKITHSCGTSELPVQNAEEYPSLCPITSEGHTVPADVLKKSIQTCRFAILSDAELKPSLGNLCIDFKGNSMVSAATNQFIIARFEQPDIEGEEMRYQIPPKTMALLLLALDDVIKDKEALDVVHIRKNSNTICIQTDSASIYFCQTEHRYPNYDAVFGQYKSMGCHAVLNRMDLLSAVVRASLFTDAASMLLTFRFDGSKEYMTICGKDIEFSTSSEEKVRCEFTTGKSLSICFKATFIKDILLHLSSEQICLSMLDHSRPGIFTEENGNPNVKILAMPFINNV